MSRIQEYRQAATNYFPDKQEGTSTRRSSFWTAYQNELTSFNLKVYQKNDAGNDLSGTTVGRWSGSTFVDGSSGATKLNITVTKGNIEILRGDQGVYNIPKEKFNRWENNEDVRNHRVFQMVSTTPTLTSRFKKAQSTVTVKNYYPEYTTSGAGGQIAFKDPWLIDYADPDFNNATRNRGKDAEFVTQNSPFTPGFSAINGKLYNGVFLNETFTNPDNPFYSVKGISESINFGGVLGNRETIFYEWTGVNTSFQNASEEETDVVFTNATAEARANLKVSQLSNKTTAFKTNQRKVAHSPNDWEHMVYESLGNVWYEAKAPSGDWEFVEGPGGFHMGDGTKSPSIAVKSTTTGWPWQYMTAAVWQDGTNIRLQTFRYDSGSGTFISAAPYELFSTGQSASYNTQPNVLWTGNEELIALYKTSSGIKYKVYTFHATQFYLEEAASGTISGTSGAVNFTAAADSYQNNHYIGLAWEEDMGISGPPYYYGTEIKFASLTYLSGSSSATVTVTPRRISNGSVVRNKEPSILVNQGTGKFVVGWISGLTSNSTWGDPYDTRATVASIVGCPWVICTSRSNLDHHVRSVSVSKLLDDSEFYAGWSQIYDQTGYIDYNKFVEGSALYTFKTLNTKGWDVQLTSASADDDINALSYYPKATPYYWLKSNSLGSYLKQLPLSTTQSRVLVLSDSAGTAGVSIGIGEFFVDGQPIGFVPVSQFESDSTGFVFGQGTQRLQKIEDVANGLSTQPFQINENSELTFDEYILFGDSLSVLGLLDKQGKVTIKINLVNNETEQLEAVLREYSITKENGLTRSKKSWNVDVSQFNEGEKRIELVVSTNLKEIKAEIETSYSDDFARGKLQPKDFEELEPVKSEVVVKYQLSQNYPNPFNPSTQIEYQIPNAGLVQLEVFDILGRKVQTLVNESQEVGTYTVTFDASALSSGVYLYRLTSGSFISSKKLFLIK